jgi:DNA-binding MarR family transcriptional regulator
MHVSTDATLAPEITPQQLADDLGRLMDYLKGAAKGNPLDAVAELELSVSQARTLVMLDRLGGSAAVGVLAGRLPLSQGATSRVVEGLHRGGLVERQEDPSDRRVKRVTITPAGRATVERFDEFREAKVAALHDFAALLDSDDRALLGAALARVLSLPEIAPGDGCA